MRKTGVIRNELLAEIRRKWESREAEKREGLPVFVGYLLSENEDDKKGPDIP